MNESIMFFPKNKNWDWYPIRRGPITIEPGGKVTLWDKKGSGWIYYALIQCNNPKLQIKIDCYADTINEIIVDIETLYNVLGNTGLGQGYFNVTKYDTTNNIYVVQYAPISLGVPFRDRNVCTLRNPTTSSIIVNLVQA